MKPRIHRSLLLLAAGVSVVCAQSPRGTRTENIHLADPTIFVHEGTYYLYGTNDLNSSEGFPVYTSTDLTTWEGPKGVQDGNALKKGDAYGTKGFWAPQVFEYNRRFYMAYTADEHIAFAESKSLLGPFTHATRQEADQSEKQIDPFVYFTEDGRTYVYQVRFDHGNNIYVSEVTDDLSRLRKETLVPCITARSPWENAEKTDWPVAEGATVIKHKGVYYLIYSANDFRSRDYAVGYATSSGVRGPWTKSSRNPIISRTLLGVNGTGHGDVFFDKQGAMWYVFHTHHSATQPIPRKTALVRIRFVEDPAGGADHLEVEPDSFRFLTVTR